jgi:hypothetical protein
VLLASNFLLVLLLVLLLEGVPVLARGVLGRVRVARSASPSTSAFRRVVPTSNTAGLAGGHGCTT